MSAHALVVDDQPAISDLLWTALTVHGPTVDAAAAVDRGHGRALSRARILAAAWEFDSGYASRTGCR